MRGGTSKVHGMVGMKRNEEKRKARRGEIRKLEDDRQKKVDGHSEWNEQRIWSGKEGRYSLVTK